MSGTAGSSGGGGIAGLPAFRRHLGLPRGVKRLNGVDVIRIELRSAVIVGVHDGAGPVGVAEAESMPKLMEYDAEEIDRIPVFIFVEMQIARNRFDIQRCGIKRMAEDVAGTVEGIRITMGTVRKQDRQRTRGVGVLGTLEVDLDVPAPLGQPAFEHLLQDIGRNLASQLHIAVLNVGASLPRPIPSVADEGNVLSNRAFHRDRPRAGHQRGSVNQFLGGWKHIGHLIILDNLVQLFW